MNRTTRPRTMSKLNDSTHRLLESYALAATAAGVGVLALAPPGEAKIVYTPAHHVLKTGTSYNLDLNHDKVVDFTLKDVAASDTDSAWWSLSASPAKGNGARGFKTLQGPSWASALKPGAVIGGNRQYFPGKVMAFALVTEGGSTFVDGSWVSVKQRYLGLKFYVGKKVHYGWARLNVSSKVGSISATLTGYAYETIPNRPIIAGKTNGSDVVTVEPASLGRLAQGSAGLAVWRSGK
jgi:hypothetical protein